jgi:lysophospholipase L1-like esterase
MDRYCQERSIRCLDLLPLFRARQTEGLYLNDDVWHLTERGHQLVAEELEEYLVRQELLSRK